MCPVHMGSNNPTHSITLKKLTVWHYYEIVLKPKQNKSFFDNNGAEISFREETSAPRLFFRQHLLKPLCCFKWYSRFINFAVQY